MRWYNPFAYVTQLRSDSAGYNPELYHSPYSATLVTSLWGKVKNTWVVIFGTQFKNAEEQLEFSSQDKSVDKKEWSHYQDIYYGLSDYLLLLIPDTVMERFYTYKHWYIYNKKEGSALIDVGHVFCIVLLGAIAILCKAFQILIQSIYIFPLFVLSLPIVTLVHWGSVIAAWVLEKRAEVLSVYLESDQSEVSNEEKNEKRQEKDLESTCSVTELIYSHSSYSNKTAHQLACENYVNRSRAGIHIADSQTSTKTLSWLSEKGELVASSKSSIKLGTTPQKKAVVALLHLGLLKTDKNTAQSLVCAPVVQI